MASLNDIETKVRHIIDILEARTIKTITGVLPLTFTAKGGTAVDWVISGNAQGVGEMTVNLFESVQQGTWIATNFRKADHASRCRSSNIIDVVAGEQYTLHWETTGETAGTAYVNYNNDAGDEVGHAGWFDASTSKTVTFTIPANATKAEVIFMLSGAPPCTPSDFTNIMLVKGSSVPSTYVPYGYQIPLTVSQQGQPDKTVDIYIGDSPLTEGKTVSKTSTGVDIELFEGENTISTTLYNKPEMTIKYKY